MGRWAQARKRGRGVASAGTLPVPILAEAESGQLVWSVVGVAPTSAVVEFFDGVSWDIEETIPWADQPVDASVQPGDYRIRGLDGSAVPDTAYSNVVTIA